MEKKEKQQSPKRPDQNGGLIVERQLHDKCSAQSFFAPGIDLTAVFNDDSVTDA